MLLIFRNDGRWTMDDGQWFCLRYMIKFVFIYRKINMNHINHILRNGRTDAYIWVHPIMILFELFVVLVLMPGLVVVLLMHCLD